MMQFLLIAHDGKDDLALERRLAARQAHLALGDQLKASGNLLFATAILDQSGTMAGSMLVLEYEDRAGLDAWLEREPYLTGDVWREVEISECRVGPAFARPGA